MQTEAMKSEMLAEKQTQIRKETAQGTGAEIDIEVSRSGVQTGLKLWFADLGRGRSPIVELKPYGLNRYQAELYFGNFAAETIMQMKSAEGEECQLARALVKSICQSALVSISGSQSLENWSVTGPEFRIIVDKRGVRNRFDDDALVASCHEFVIPLLAAMAELYGYDEVEDSDTCEYEASMEGAIGIALVKRRERNPRNRLLCLRLHGYKCKICHLDPRTVYGSAGKIIEVHHLQPLSSLESERSYDPTMDLIPVCPNCHAAMHTRRPVPLTPEEVFPRECDHE